jgi:small subunit ribosomal protein S2
MAESHVSVEALLEAGAHFGHLTRRWNPKMRKFIFNERNGIHIIDLRKTQILVDYARDVIHEIAARGRIVLFVGTKHQAKPIIEQQATRAGMNYVSERWLGGMLTNFQTIRKSIKRLTSIDKMEADGTFDNIVKKERLLLTREKDRLRKVFGGIETMSRLPSAMFVVDAKKEHLAVKEARVLGIPVIGIIDTNTDPDMVDFPIPANDDSVQAIEIITSIMADAIIDGAAVAKIRRAELGYDPNAKEKRVEEANSDRNQRRDRGDNRGGRGDNRGSRGDSRGSRGDNREGGRGDNRGGQGQRSDNPERQFRSRGQGGPRPPRPTAEVKSTENVAPSAE